jgi:cell division protein FtsZ
MFEGRRRELQADRGLLELKECVDTVIAIPNEKLLHTVERGTSISKAFAVADDVLRQAVQGISDLITVRGEINRDFRDVRTVMSGMGMALMGTGIAEGADGAMEAAQRAISSPLLEDTSITGARALLVNVTGSSSMGLHEVADAIKMIKEAADPEANIFFGYVFDENLGDKIKITVIATGFEADVPHQLKSAAHRSSVCMAGVAQPVREVAERIAEATGTDGQELDYDLPLMKEDLDIPAFLRKKAN